MVETADTAALPQTVEADTIKFLRLLIGPCTGRADSHGWSRCQRCLAVHELQNRSSLAERLVKAAADALEGRAQAPAPDKLSHVCRQIHERAYDAGTNEPTVNWSEMVLMREALGVPQDVRPHCQNMTPPAFVGHWRDWHRGHGCNRDDGKPRSNAGQVEIDALLPASTEDQKDPQ